MCVLVGTSGWQYRDWRGVLYPAGVSQRRWLEHYSSQYATVENNGSFYRLPSPQTFADWRARTPAGFLMAVKASRYLTHVRRLRDPAEPVGRLLGAAAGLGDRLGPVLLQLPPNLAADPAALEGCLRAFAGWRADGQATAGQAADGEATAGQAADGEAAAGQAADGQAAAGSRVTSGKRVRVAVEFRHESWWTDQIRELLARHGAAACWADRLGRPVGPLWRTADWGYLRLHEGAAQPHPRYGERALHSWVRRITEAWPDGSEVFVYFNNDPGGAAVYDAAAFASLASGAGLEVSRTAVPGEPAP